MWTDRGTHTVQYIARNSALTEKMMGGVVRFWNWVKFGDQRSILLQPHLFGQSIGMKSLSLRCNFLFCSIPVQPHPWRLYIHWIFNWFMDASSALFFFATERTGWLKLMFYQLCLPLQMVYDTLLTNGAGTACEHLRWLKQIVADMTLHNLSHTVKNVVNFLIISNRVYFNIQCAFLKQSGVPQMYFSLVKKLKVIQMLVFTTTCSS